MSFFWGHFQPEPDLQVLQLLLASAANVNARCGHSCTALSWAAISDNAEAVQLLLDAKVDPLLKA